MGAMRRFGRLQVALAIGGLGLGLACGSDESGGGAGGKEPIRVGHVASLTGDTATFGQSTDRGMRMALEEINAKGGVLGRPLELLTEDDRSITEEARTAAQKLLQRDQVVALLGEVASSRSLAAAPEAQRAQVPMISPGSTNPKVTEVGDYIFRVCFIDPFQGTVMARFAAEELKVEEGRDPARLQAGLLGRPRRLLPQDVHRARRRDRRRRALHERRHRLPRAAHDDPRREARRDLRARLLHRGRPDREAGARARHQRAAARRRRLGLGEDARDRRRARSRATTSRTTTRPTPTARRSRSSCSATRRSTTRRPTRWPRSATTRPASSPTRSTRAGDRPSGAKLRDAIAATKDYDGVTGKITHRRRSATRTRTPSCSRSRTASSSSTARCRRV